ncbi:hypothetical protein M8J77_006798 [Diaphorina citri]|nr:hypothetical protein M8J77_006798 [Diaphorina citri]
MFLNHSVFEAIFKLASNGRFIRLKAFLEARTHEEIQMVTKFKFGGATPLIMACRNGHKEIVEYLVKECKADVEETGAVMFDHETVEGAPPLWCAAAAGHLPIVQFLVEHGAKVNSKTRTNSTPLRAACFDGHFGVVKYLVEHGADFEVSNRHGHTCLMIACYKGHYRIVKYLLSLNADMNRKSSKGNTALHDCAEAGSIEILKLLLSHGARMDVDSYGMTPLLAAAVVGHQHIVEYLIGLNIVSRKEKIDALELLGATFVDRKKDMVSAVELWKRAMDLRYKEGEPPISKPHSPQTIEAYEHAREVYDPESLAEIVADPDGIKNQALLIRERILGPAHPDTIYFLRYRGAMYADAGKFARCISLWNYALDMQQSMLEPLNHMTLSTFYSFSELFEYMLSDRTTASASLRRVTPITADELITILEKCLHEAKSSLKYNITDEALLQRLITLTLNIASLLLTHWKDAAREHCPNHWSENCASPVQEEDERIALSSSEQHRVYRTLFEFVKINLRGRDSKSILHYSCHSLYTSPLTPHNVAYKTLKPPLIPNRDVTRILLKVGANPNDVDCHGNTALHMLAENYRHRHLSLLQLLLDHGAHYDSLNAQRKSFLSILHTQFTSESSDLHNDLHANNNNDVHNDNDVHGQNHQNEAHNNNQDNEGHNVNNEGQNVHYNEDNPPHNLHNNQGNEDVHNNQENLHNQAHNLHRNQGDEDVHSNQENLHNNQDNENVHNNQAQNLHNHHNVNNNEGHNLHNKNNNQEPTSSGVSRLAAAEAAFASLVARELNHVRFTTLACLAARVIQTNRIKVGHAHLPPELVAFIAKH